VIFSSPTDSRLIREHFQVFSEMERRKIFERLLRSNLADILTHLVIMTRKWPRPAYVQRDFAQLWADFQKLGQYFPAERTLN